MAPIDRLSRKLNGSLERRNQAMTVDAARRRPRSPKRPGREKSTVRKGSTGRCCARTHMLRRPGPTIWLRRRRKRSRQPQAALRARSGLVAALMAPKAQPLSGASLN